MEVLYPACAGLDVHKDTVVACSRCLANGKVIREVRTFKTTAGELLALSEWLSLQGVTHIAMEAAGVYWKPVWNILSGGDFTLTLANAHSGAHHFQRRTKPAQIERLIAKLQSLGFEVQISLAGA
jgi:transposase